MAIKIQSQKTGLTKIRAGPARRRARRPRVGRRHFQRLDPGHPQARTPQQRHPQRHRPGAHRQRHPLPLPRARAAAGSTTPRPRSSTTRAPSRGLTLISRLALTSDPACNLGRVSVELSKPSGPAEDGPGPRDGVGSRGRPLPAGHRAEPVGAGALSGRALIGTSLSVSLLVVALGLLLLAGLLEWTTHATFWTVLIVLVGLVVLAFRGVIRWVLARLAAVDRFGPLEERMRTLVEQTRRDILTELRRIGLPGRSGPCRCWRCGWPAGAAGRRRSSGCARSTSTVRSRRPGSTNCTTSCGPPSPAPAVAPSRAAARVTDVGHLAGVADST